MTILLKAFGYTTEDLLRIYYPIEEIKVVKGKLFRKLDPQLHPGIMSPMDIVGKKSREVIAKEGNKLTKALIEKIISAGVNEIPVTKEDLDRPAGPSRPH